MAKKQATTGFPMERIRNFGIIAHIDAGKTTTTEQILYYTNKQHRIGSVDEGNTTTDWLEQERERGISIVAAAVTTHWTPAGAEQHRLNVIDTPGHIDFTAEVERSLSVLDGAIAVFCGVAGVQPQSTKVWGQATAHDVPRIAFVNKLDRSGANFHEVVADIEAKLIGMKPLVVQLPIGEEKEFKGVVDLVEMKAWTWSEGDPPPAPVAGPIPPELVDDAQLYRGELVEKLGDLDDEIAARVMEGQPLDGATLRASLRRVTLGLKGFPVLCGASFRHKGVQPLLDAICHYLPAPLDRPPVKGRRPKSKRGARDGAEARDEDWLEADRPPSPKAPFCALAFKTYTSPTGDLCYLRVYSGQTDGSEQLLNVRTGKKERLGRLYVVDASKKTPTESAQAGDIVAVVGLRYTVTGDTLSDGDSPILLGAITFPLPVVSMAVEPRTTADKDKLGTALANMSKDDPTFHVRQDTETGQTIISGMGELHLEIVADRIKREWNVECKVGKPRVSYKQTARGTARARHSVDFTVGEQRRFGDVEVEVVPKSGAGAVRVEFPVDPALVPEAFHPAIEDAIKTKASSIGDWGDPLIDVVVRVTGGSTHPVDAHESAYSAAASRAIEEACDKAGLQSLEPVMTVVIEVPEELFGTISQDLNGRRSEIIERSDPVRGSLKITAAVPLAEMFGYANDIRSRTQGRASFTMEPRAYALVPEGKRPKLF